MRIVSLLVRRRVFWAAVTGVALWSAWLLSVTLGPWPFDLAGQIVGTDYLQFHAAGETLLRGDGERLYDLVWQHRLQESLVGARFEGLHGFLNPPFFAWLFVPLAALPYGWGFVVWSILGVVFLALSFVALGSERLFRSTALGLAFFPVFASISFGQNGTLSLLILAVTWSLWSRDLQGAAGLCASLLLYKPHLLIGVLALWLLRPRRDLAVLVGFATGSLAIVATSFAFTSEASEAFVRLSAGGFPALMRIEGFPIWHAHTLRGFWYLLLPRGTVLVELAWIVSSVACATAFYWLVRSRQNDRETLFAAAIVVTLLVTPHALIYDWALLVIPFLLLFDRVPHDEELRLRLVVLMWGATLVAVPLTLAQLGVFGGYALQITLPALLIASGWAWRDLVFSPGRGPVRRGSGRGPGRDSSGARSDPR